MKKKKVKSDTKKVFWKLGTCSRTSFYLLNREFGYPIEHEERASDPLAGGIIQKGHQCGLLWGSTLAVGAESYRRNKDKDKAIGQAITATKHIVDSFSRRTNTVNCREITKCDFSNIFSFAKYMITGKALGCFDLADKWIPEAIESAGNGLADNQSDLPVAPMSCACEVAKKMGATDEQMVMVAGFAGGMGLSGNGCGALGAAVWMKSLDWCKKETKKSSFLNPDSKKTLEVFSEATDSELLCHKICGKRFKTVEEHTEFVKNGGCEKLITLLAQS